MFFDFNSSAQRAHARQRAMAVRSRREMTQLTCAFGQSRKHRVTMRDGLVPRQIQPTGQVFRRTNDLFFHEEILTRRKKALHNWRRVPISISKFPFSVISHCPRGQFFAANGLYHTLKSPGPQTRIIG